MAEVNVDGATWQDVTAHQAVAIVEAALADHGGAVSVQVARSYTQRVGQATWDVKVGGIGLNTVQGIEQDLRQLEVDRG